MKMQKILYLISAVLIWQSFLFAQYAERQDVVWAKMVPAGTITLDGNLTEPAWANAEEIQVVYGTPGPLPTSAWRAEFQEDVYYDQTNATVKFLTSTDNQLYLGFYIPDSSIGGIQDWARWDAILMSIKDKLDPTRAAPAVEYFYTWWYVNATQYLQPGVPPRFIGRYGNFSDTTRTPEQIAAWDAVSIIKGLSNDDSVIDTAWIVEMRVDLGVLGYDVTVPEGDIVALNFSIWDGDWIFSGTPSRITSSRTWFQGPWGNANDLNVARVFGRPDITTATTNLPVILPDVILPNGSNHTAPVIDGNLDEPVWSGAYEFEIEWDNVDLRNSYPTTGPLSSGQFQPELGGNPRPPVVDPAYAKIKMFFRDQYLYLAADVDDQLVQGTEEYDKIDGVSFMIGDRSQLDPLDNYMPFRILRVSFNNLGEAAAYDYLPVLVDSGYAQWAVTLKGATTVNVNTDIDEGYRIEMRLDLTKLGYPPDLGDKLLFMGVMHADGDSFDDPLANYGTRTWWFREQNIGPSAAWMVLDPLILVGVEDENISTIPNTIEIYGNYPNPFNPSTKIKYSIPEAGDINISIYNAIGELISSEVITVNHSGTFEYQFNSNNISSGVYFYKVSLTGSSNKILESNIGKMILLK
jgi:hypothetical protein